LCGAHGFADALGAMFAEVVGVAVAAVSPGGRGLAGAVVLAGVVGTAVGVVGALAVAVTSGGLVAVTAGAVAVALATAGGALSAGFSVVM